MADPILETRKLTKRFGALAANEDVSIDLRSNEIHAIIGPNGAGKSTLIKQICGGLKPDSGDVLISGETVTAHNTQQRSARGLGRTFQISALAMQDSVLENAVLGVIGRLGKRLSLFSNALKNSEFVEPALKALEQAGLEKQLDYKASELSHGERRQLELAIALTLSPKAFIMDEPMAGLGAGGTKQMTEVLSELRFQAPILLVEHDMDAVFALADRISVLVYGRVIACGTVDEIRNDPAVREAYLGNAA
ncbi:MAG: ABC transporter ATP-binding protein [Pseudomonadota bacterium]